ncbi:MAG: TnsA endonuclease N-terminal domain-containing protein [Janthinobacterium lividum]
MSPARKFRIGYCSLHSAYPSVKAGRIIQLESALERDYACLLEFDQAVASYMEQPVTLSYQVPTENKQRRYTPDFLVHYVDEQPTQLVEIKYRADLRAHWTEYKPKFRAAQQYAASQGWLFTIYTEEEIRSPYLQNARFLLRFQSPPAVIRQEYVDLLLEAIEKLDETTPAEVLLVIFQDANRRAELLPTLWYLLSKGLIGCNLFQPLTMSSSLWALE